MKKTFIIVASLLLNLVFMQNRNCSEIINPEECYNMGCEWDVNYDLFLDYLYRNTKNYSCTDFF